MRRGRRRHLRELALAAPPRPRAQLHASVGDPKLAAATVELSSDHHSSPSGSRSLAHTSIGDTNDGEPSATAVPGYARPRVAPQSSQTGAGRRGYARPTAELRGADRAVTVRPRMHLRSEIQDPSA